MTKIMKEIPLFTEHFGPTATRRARFTKAPSGPLISAGDGDWSQDFIAACSVVEHDGELRLYAEGSANGHEQIGLFTRTNHDPDADWVACASNPILRVDPDGYSQGGVFDPSVVRFGDQWLMYFSATEGDAHEYAEQLVHGTAEDGPSGESIGLATSSDGKTFKKHPQGPLMSGRCPFAVVLEDVIYLFHVVVRKGGYRIHLSTSRNGTDFCAVTEEPVLDVGGVGSWDSRSVTTPKVFEVGNTFWMSYAGDDSGFDDLKGVGLASSKDLVVWTKIEDNPILRIGEEGEFDSVSVQSPIIIPVDGGYSMFYAGSDKSVGEGLHSQVGLARLVVQ